MEIGLGLWDAYTFQGLWAIYIYLKNKNKMLEFFKNTFQGASKNKNNAKTGDS